MTRRKVYEWLAWNGVWVGAFLLVETTEGIATFGLAALVVWVLTRGLPVDRAARVPDVTATIPPIGRQPASV